MTTEVKQPTLDFILVGNRTSTGFVRSSHSPISQAYIGSQPIRIGESGERSRWLLNGVNTELIREVGRYLGTPSVLLRSLDEATSRLGTRINARLARDDRRLFMSSMRAIVRIMAETALEVAFPRIDQEYVSRMGKSFVVPQTNDESRVVLLKISRGGDTPTHFASEHLESILLHPPEILQASSQRKQLKKDEKPKVVYQIKGRTDLTGKTLMIFEQAHASAETVVNVIPAALKKCKSQPDRIIMCCINSCAYAILATLQAIPEVIIVSACMHNALTDKWYLDDVGCGDCGAEEHRVVD